MAELAELLINIDQLSISDSGNTIIYWSDTGTVLVDFGPTNALTQALANAMMEQIKISKRKKWEKEWSELMNEFQELGAYC